MIRIDCYFAILLISFWVVIFKSEIVLTQSCTNDEIGIRYLQKYGYTTLQEFEPGKFCILLLFVYNLHFSTK